MFAARFYLASVTFATRISLCAFVFQSFHAAADSEFEAAVARDGRWEVAVSFRAFIKLFLWLQGIGVVPGMRVLWYIFKDSL